MCFLELVHVVDRRLEPFDGDVVLLRVIPQRGMNRLLGQQRAMHLDRRQTAQRLHHRLVGDLQRLLHRLADNHLGRHGAGRDGRAAAEGLELRVAHDLVLVDIQEDAHDVAALGVADRAHAAGVINLAHIARVHEMIHHFFGIHNLITPLNLLLRDKIRVERGHAPQARDDLLELIDDEIRIRHRRLLAEGQAQRTVRDLVRAADGQQHVRRIQRAAGAGRTAGRADALRIEQHQHTLALDEAEADVDIARQALFRVAVEPRVGDLRQNALRQMIAHGGDLRDVFA